MPKVDVTWEQYEAISAILKAAHAAGTLKDYGSAEGLVKLVSEIDREQSDSHKRLKGIHLGHLTGLINSPKKVKAILGIQDPEDPQIKDWDMPKVDVTWEQYEAISAILKAAHAAGTLKDYGSAEGLVKLVSEIDREQSDSHKRLKGIHLGQLTGLINSPKKVKAILGIQDPEDPQIKDWDMPNINVTWEQYAAQNRTRPREDELERDGPKQEASAARLAEGRIEGRGKREAEKKKGQKKERTSAARRIDKFDYRQSESLKLLILNVVSAHRGKVSRKIGFTIQLNGEGFSKLAIRVRSEKIELLEGKRVVFDWPGDWREALLDNRRLLVDEQEP